MINIRLSEIILYHVYIFTIKFLEISIVHSVINLYILFILYF